MPRAGRRGRARERRDAAVAGRTGRSTRRVRAVGGAGRCDTSEAASKQQRMSDERRTHRRGAAPLRARPGQRGGPARRSRAAIEKAQGRQRPGHGPRLQVAAPLARDCMRANQRVLELDPTEARRVLESGHRRDSARRMGRRTPRLAGLRLDLPDGDGPLELDLGMAPVRLNPERAAKSCGGGESIQPVSSRKRAVARFGLPLGRRGAP